MMKSLRTVLAGLVLLSVAAAGALAFPITVTDDTGFDVRIPTKPQRIVSLTMMTDEILLDIVSKDRILAVTSFAVDPDISNITDRVVDIPNKISLNVEIVLSLRPDIVFVANWSEADKITQLRQAGISVFLIESPLTVPAIQSKIRTIGRIVGEQTAARRIVSEMNRRLGAVAEAVSAIPERERKSVLDYAVWGTAQGVGTSWQTTVERAGLVNAVAEIAVDEWGQVPVSKEKIIELDPDILILPGWVYGDPEGARNFFKQTLNDPALRTMSAIRNNEVYMMSEGLKTTTSQYIVDAVEYLAEIAYPDHFE